MNSTSAWASAGTSAALAIDEGCSLQKLPYPKLPYPKLPYPKLPYPKLPYPKLRDRLLADGQILVPPPPKPKEEKKAE